MPSERFAYIDFSIRYTGDYFEGGQLEVGYSVQSLQGLSYLAGAFTDVFAEKGITIVPSIKMTRVGSWEIITQLVWTINDTLCAIGNSPQVSALANIAGVTASFISAIALLKVKNHEKFLSIIKKRKKYLSPHDGKEFEIDKSTVDLIKNTNFHRAIDSIILFSTSRSGVHHVNFQINNDYIDVDRSDNAYIDNNIIKLNSAAQAPTRIAKAAGRRCYIENMILRFHGLNEKGRGAYFVDAFAKLHKCLFLNRALEIIHMKYDSSLVRGGLYECEIMISERDYVEFPNDYYVMNIRLMSDNFLDPDIVKLDKSHEKELIGEMPKRRS